MKVALILASNKSHSPYVKVYEEILKDCNIEYDIVVWNRHDIQEDDCISYSEEYFGRPIIKKIKAYWNYRRFVKRILSDNDYQKVVVFTIFLGLLLRRTLKTKYFKNYILDIRDFSSILKFPTSIVSLIQNSCFIAISSPGFKTWLPASQKYVITHNYAGGPVVKKQFSPSTTDIIILTIGSLRDFEINRQLIDALKNQTSFKLRFVGDGPAAIPLKKYVEDNNIGNITFHGYYTKDCESNFLRDVSIVNALTAYDINSRTLMTNRFYLALSNSLPVLVSSNTRQAEVTEKYRLGVVCQNISDIKNDIENYFTREHPEDFHNYCKKFIESVVADNENFGKHFIDYLENRPFISKISKKSL